MFKHLLLGIACAMFSLTLFGNTINPESVTLCSGEKMSWEMYQLNKKMMSYQYDMEIESVEFVGFAPSMMNNQNGAWSSIVNMPIIAGAAAHMPDGRILTWSAKDKLVFGGDNGRTWTCIFDPSNNSVSDALVENTSHDMFCPSATLLPDSRVMVNGGSSAGKTSIYDPMTGGWSAADELNIPRGYHGGMIHSSGAVFVAGGSWSGAVGNKHSEVWTEKTGWFELPGVLSEVITDGVSSNQPAKQDDYFAWLWNAPNGQIFHAGPSNKMHWIDPTGVGSWTQAGTRGNSDYSTVGMSVMYDEGKILTLGGSTTFEGNTIGSNKCYTIDINSNNAVAAQTGNMANGRAYGNAVVLPNGEVMAIGGQDVADIWNDDYAILATELWNPNTGQWRNIATMSVPRSYHSTALLLTDGRVLVAGGGLCSSNCPDANHPDAQIYSPPYLFNNNGGLAARPTITSAPTVSDWNTNMVVNTNATIANFVLQRMTAVTHSTSNGQRRIPVNFSNNGGNQYAIQIPNRNILPPGNYMLFAFNNNGVPSVAKVINIGDDINDCTPQGHANLGGTGLQGTYYNNIDFTNEVLQRNDATINFNWGTGAPPGIAVDSWSAIWEGRIKVPRDGYYSFYTTADDGVKLWVNGRLMVDNPTAYDDGEDQGFVELFAGQDHDIRIEYKEGTQGARMQLRWSGPGIAKGIVASQYLFPPDPCDDNDFTIVCEQNTNDAGYVIDGNCYIPVCPGDKLILSVNPNGYPTSWTGPNGYTNNNNNALIANSINNTHFGDYIATVNVNGCIKTETIRVAAGAGCDPCFGNGGDADGDGICGNEDCNDNNPNLPTTVGSSCNDGNTNTTNDVIQADGCTCQGTPVGGNCQTTTNVALNKPATQSSTLTANGVTGNAGNAVDGNTDGVYWNGSVSATNSTSQPWWQVDLGGQFNIEQIRVYNRTEGSSRLENFQVMVSNTAFSNNLNTALGQASWSQNTSGNAGTPSNFTLNETARYVRVQANGTSYLTIAEVQVIGCSDGNCIDNDNDGFCAADDCNDNNASIPTSPGTSCNDGNSNTTNDVIQSDGCTCAGTPVGNNDCVAAYTVSGNSLTFTGLTNPINAAKIIDLSYTTYWECNTWATGCNSSETINNIPSGEYYISLNTYDAGWNVICNIFESVTIGGTGCTDNDNDGVCNDQDCAPNNPNLPAPVGSSCNDGNGNTTNDVIQSDGCTCAGTPVGGGCPVVVTTGNGAITITGLIGTNAKIFNDSWQEQWGCNPWTGNPCGNSETYNSGPGTYYVSVSSATCNFFEIVTVGGTGCTDSDSDGTCDADDCSPNNPSLPAPVGSSCNDFNSNTNNDVIQSDGCTCEGTPIGGGGCNINYTTTGSAITISGLTDPIVSAKVYDAAYNPIFQCGTFGTPCNATETINNLSPGGYVVIYQSHDSNWNLLCDGFENVSLGNLVDNGVQYFGQQDQDSVESNLLRNGLGKINTTLFPNPASEVLNVSFEMKLDNKDVQLEIYNTLGQSVYQRNIDNLAQIHEINLSSFENGIYHLNIVHDGKITDTKMFVVTK